MAPPAAPAPPASTALDQPVSVTAQPPPATGAGRQEPAMEPDVKRPLTFLCRADVRHATERMAEELECSVDYLINTALRQYLRQRSGAQAAVVAPGLVVAPVLVARTGVGGEEQLVVLVDGERHPIAKSTFVIGRLPRDGIDLAISDGNVSRKHAQIERHDGQWFLVDLGSANGLWSKGQRIARMPLQGGEVVNLGDRVLRFVFEPVGG